MAEGIKAGEAFISLTMESEESEKAIQDFQDQAAKSFNKLLSLGKKLTSLGTIIVSPFIAGAAVLKSYAATAGITSASVQSSYASMASAAGDLQAGNVMMAHSFSLLGVSMTEFQSASSPERLELIARGLAGIANESVRAALAVQLLGTAGKDLVQRLGPDGLAAFAAQLAKTGTLSQDAADAAFELQMAWIQMRASVATLTGELAAMIPEIAKTFSFITDLAGAVRDFAREHPVLVRFIAAIGALTVAIGLAAGAVALFMLALLPLVVAMGPVVISTALIATGIGLVVAALADSSTVVAFAANAWGAFLIVTGKLVESLGALTALIPGLRELGTIVTDIGAGMVETGENFTAVTPEQIEDQKSLSGLATGATNRSGLLTTTSAGIQGSFASQETLGLAGAGGQASTADLLEQANEKTDRTNELLREQIEDTREGKSY